MFACSVFFIVVCLFCILFCIFLLLLPTWRIKLMMMTMIRTFTPRHQAPGTRGLECLCWYHYIGSVGRPTRSIDPAGRHCIGHEAGNFWKLALTPVTRTPNPIRRTRWGSNRNRNRPKRRVFLENLPRGTLSAGAELARGCRGPDTLALVRNTHELNANPRRKFNTDPA